jgi:hypothetical protein
MAASHLIERRPSARPIQGLNVADFIPRRNRMPHTPSASSQVRALSFFCASFNSRVRKSSCFAVGRRRRNRDGARPLTHCYGSACGSSSAAAALRALRSSLACCRSYPAEVMVLLCARRRVIPLRSRRKPEFSAHTARRSAVIGRRSGRLTRSPSLSFRERQRRACWGVTPRAMSRCHKLENPLSGGNP